MKEAEKRIFNRLLQEGFTAREIMEILEQLRDLAINSVVGSQDDTEETTNSKLKNVVL